MSPALPRTSFNSSTLVRNLSNLAASNPAAVDVAEPKQTLAERLSPWLAWTDAIALSAVLEGGSTANRSGPQAGQSAPALAAHEELASVRADLTRSIMADPVFTAAQAGRERPAAPADPADPAGEGPASFVPYRHQYVTHQRAMEARIGLLRARVRAALSGESPNLRRLVALDAVLEKALSARERQLLSTVPQWLEKHFKHACLVGQGFDAKDLQGLLLAELETRLQPVEGLMAALGNGARP